MSKSSARGSGLFCATVGLAAVVTAGFGWLEVMVGWGIGAVLCLAMPEGKEANSRTKAIGTMLCCEILLLGVLIMAEKAFPQDSTFPFVSLGLLMLLYRTRIGEGDTGRMVSNVLGLILAGMFGAILLLGAANGHTGDLAIQEFRWKRVWITAVLSMPWWQEKDAWGWYTLGGVYLAGMSVLCRMVLGAALTEYSRVPLYRTAQAIEVLGTNQHLEGIVAVGVLMGVYSMLCQIGERMSRYKDTLRQNTSSKIWWGIVLLVVFVAEWGYWMMGTEGRMQINTVFWGFTGVFALLVVILRKMKKVLDKWRIVG